MAIDLDALIAEAAQRFGGVDEDDPPVFWKGETTVPIEAPTSGKGGLKVRRAPAGERTVSGKQRKSSDVYLEFYRMSPAQVQALQGQFFNAGMYGNAAATAIPWGEHDDDTFRLWKAYVDRAARFTSVGDDRDPRDLIGQSAARGPLGAGGGQPLAIFLDNPADVAHAVRKIARELGAGNVSEDEVARIVREFQSQSAAAQRSGHAANTKGGTATGAQSLATFTESKLQGSHETELGSNRLIESANIARRVLTGGTA